MRKMSAAKSSHKRAYRQLSNDLHECIVRAVQDAQLSGRTHKNIAAEFNTTVSNVRRIWSVYEREGRTRKKPRPTRRTKLNAEQQTAVARYAREHPDAELTALVDWTATQFDIHTCTATICRILQRQGDAYNVSTTEPERRNDTGTKRIRKQYIEEFLWISTGTGKRLFYVDEFSINASLRKRRGWARKGTRPRYTAPVVRGCRVSVIACVEENLGLVYYEIHRDTVDGDTFRKFVERLIRAIDDELDTDEGVLVLDNSSVHRSDDLEELTGEHENLNFQFLPPYSPMLNPIENMFSVWKNKARTLLTRGRVQTYDELESVVKAAGDAVTREKVQHACNHLAKFFDQCIREEDIVDI